MLAVTPEATSKPVLMKEAILRLALDAKKYKAVMDYLDQNLLGNPIAQKLDDILEEEETPAIKNSIKDSGQDLVLSLKLKQSLNNAFSNLISKAKSVQKWTDQQIKEFAEKENIPASDDSKELRRTIVESGSIDEISTIVGEANTVSTPDQPKSSVEETNSMGIGIVAIIVIVVIAMLAYFGAKSFGTYKGQKGLDL